MDNTQPTPTGNVEPTPEAGPLKPPTMRDNYTGPIPGMGAEQQAAGSGPTGAGQAGSGAGHDRGSDEIAKDVADRLKPVAEAAEDVVTKALDLSAKGLSRLVDKLEERRRDRDKADQP